MHVRMTAFVDVQPTEQFRDPAGLSLQDLHFLFFVLCSRLDLDPQLVEPSLGLEQCLLAITLCAADMDRDSAGPCVSWYIDHWHFR